MAEAYRLAIGQFAATSRGYLPLTQEIQGLVLPAVLLLGVYAIGTVAETFTDQFVDSDREKQLIWPPRLHSETYHRVTTLFKDLEAQNCNFNDLEPVLRAIALRPTAIGRAVLTNAKYQNKMTLVGDLLYIKELGKAAERFQQSPKTIEAGKKGASQHPAMELNVSCDTLGRSVNALYYLAKNWSYSDDSYFSELQAIQRKIDFLRSIYLVLGWLGLLVLVGGAIGAWRARSWAAWPPMRRALIVCGGVSLLGIATHMGWDRAEINFNERAWGYFLSHLDLQENIPCREAEKAANPLLQRTPDSAAEE
jgi:hypothetical protein